MDCNVSSDKTHIELCDGIFVSFYVKVFGIGWEPVALYLKL